MTYRGLDGRSLDFPEENSVGLLLRTRWFQDAVSNRRGGAGAEETSEGGEESGRGGSRAWANIVASSSPIPTQHLGSSPYSSSPYLSSSPAAARLAREPWSAVLSIGAGSSTAHMVRSTRYASWDDDDCDEDDYFVAGAAGQRALTTLGNRRFGEGGFISAGRLQARPRKNAPGGKAQAQAHCQASASTSPSAAAQPKLGRRAKRSARRAAEAAETGESSGAPEPGSSLRAAVEAA